MAKTKGVSKVGGRSWNLYLPGDLAWVRRELEAEAKAQRRSVSEVVLFVLEGYLKSKGNPKSKRRPLEVPSWIYEKVPD